MKKVFILLVAVSLLAGCAALQEAMSGVTTEQHTAMSSQVQAVAGPYIPAPYQIPASALIGWIACVGYNWFKKKTAVV